MKKLFSLVLLIAVALIVMPPDSKGQSVTTKTFMSAVGGKVDSVRCISTTPNYMYITPTAAYKVGVVQLTITRISTAIGGTAFLQGSIDNVNWHTATYAAGDTVTIANSASQVLLIKIPPAAGMPWKHLRIKATNASNDSLTMRAIYCGRE